jgi:hypothetical protein
MLFYEGFRRGDIVNSAEWTNHFGRNLTDEILCKYPVLF